MDKRCENQMVEQHLACLKLLQLPLLEDGIPAQGYFILKTRLSVSNPNWQQR